MTSAFQSKSYARIDVKLPLPDLIEVQIEILQATEGRRFSRSFS